MYLITDIEEYKLCVNRGHEPLLHKVLLLEINLRVQIQRQVFGHSLLSRGDIVQSNNRFYRWMWEHKPHYCEECLKPLPNYSATWISHILTRGAFPEIAHDPRNINILCGKHHDQWETGNRKQMRIYPGNIKTIELLNSEYQQLNKYESKGQHHASK